MKTVEGNISQNQSGTGKLTQSKAIGKERGSYNTKAKAAAAQQAGNVKAAQIAQKKAAELQQ